jgi:hypothetical protein
MSLKTRCSLTRQRASPDRPLSSVTSVFRCVAGASKFVDSCLSSQCDNHNVAVMSAPTDESPSTVEADGGLGEDIATVKNDTPPANAVSVALKKKEPPPESPASIRLRVYVIASFWAIVIFVGLPIWWRTTAIYRASLPVDEMMEWADGRVCLSGSGSGGTDANTNLHRHVGQSSHYGFPLKQSFSKITKHSIFYGRHNMRWMI